jgi:AcrR family transcriptional regulator
MAKDTRDKMIAGAASLLSQRGLQGTSLSDVLELTDAPRGSIYHHFPGGKNEMVAEALTMLGTIVAERIRAAEVTKPEQVSDEFVNGWRSFVEMTDFRAVCAVSAVTVGAGADAEVLLPAVASTFGSWREALADAYARTGLAKADAKRLALTAVAALEGALILARAEQSMEPFDAVQRDLSDLAKAAAARRTAG